MRHFGFDEAPFSITPDHRFVYLSPQHEESLAHLIYGINRGGGAGFVLLTGEVGTGKTTLSRLLLEQHAQQADGQSTKIALLLNPRLSPVELLEAILQELGIPRRGVTGQLNRMVNRLNDYLLKSWAKGQNTVVMIDEAQNLPPETLEQLRLLTNLETDTHKLLQIILIGQPELRDTLRRNDLRQLAQRITARYHLGGLNANDTTAYLAHRCRVAGADASPFSPAASKAIHRHSGGIPRLINTLADRALLVAWNRESPHVEAKDVKQAAAEVLDAGTDNGLKHWPWQARRLWRSVAMGTGLLALVVLGLWATGTLDPPHKPASSTLSQAASEGSITDTNPTTLAPVSAETQGHDASTPFQSHLKDWPDTLQAWRQLTALWGTHAGGWDKMQCPPAEKTGMACLRRQGNLAQIRRLNRPVLLQTSEPQQLVLLDGIDPDGYIRLRDRNERAVTVGRAWLEQHWLGTYYVLWPMPAALLHLSLPVQQSTAVTDWARQLAEQISGESLASDTALREWLKAFQARHGLLADGIIGPETAMALSLKAYTGPSLRQKATTPVTDERPAGTNSPDS